MYHDFIVGLIIYCMQYLRERHPTWDIATHLPFNFHYEALVLQLKKEDIHEGWRIQPQRFPCKVMHIVSCRRGAVFNIPTIHHQIYQKHVDSWSSAEPISCDVTLAAQEGPSTAEHLHYQVKIEGIYPEDQTIFIQRCLYSSG